MHTHIQTRRLLLDPYCYDGAFLKVQPTYVAGDAAANQAAIAAHSIERAMDGSGIIVNTAMPGFRQGTDPAVSTVLPSPSVWGNGTQVGGCIGH